MSRTLLSSKWIKPFRIIVLVGLCCSAAHLLGCGKAGDPSGDMGRELTPAEFDALPDHAKAEYRNTEIRIPEGLWGIELLPANRGPFDSIVDRAVHTGMLDALMGEYCRALFEAEHPRARVKYVPFEMWSPDFKAILAASLHSGTAPAVYVARDLPGTAQQGLFADITHLIEEWDQADLQPASAVAWGYINGRNYVIAGPDLGSMVIMYRKDWFREAGLFNEYGEPGPRTDWTWDDFRRIARQLSDPGNDRWGYADEPGDFGWAVANGFMYYVPDKTGEFTWRFNDGDPRLYTMLRQVREMKFADTSVMTTTTMGWGDWHNEFDAGRAAMIRTFSPLLASDSLNAPYKFGEDKPYGETVGMALPPTGAGGMRDLMPDANVFGFNPYLEEEELRLAFEWIKSMLYGEAYSYRMRATLDKARIFGRGDTIYRDLLVSPYRPDFELDLPKSLDEVFPADYIRAYDAIKAAPAPPLPRAFGLTEPAGQDYLDAIRSMYSAALADPDADLEEIVAGTARKVNQNTLNFKDEDDGGKLKAYYTALDAYYEENFPEFHRTVWGTLLRDHYRVW